MRHLLGGLFKPSEYVTKKMHSSWFYIKTISGIEETGLKELARLVSGRYDTRRGFGFVGTEISKTALQTTLVYQLIVTQKVFDPLTGHFTTAEQIVYEQASFEIHPAKKLLQSYAGGKRLQKVVLCLSEILKQKVAFEDIFIDIPAVLTKLRSRKIAHNITGFSVVNFRPEVGVIGKLTATVADSDVARKIIDAYSGDVLEVSLQVIADDEPSYWHLSASGRIAIKSPDHDSLASEVNLVRELILEEQDA